MFRRKAKLVTGSETGHDAAVPVTSTILKACSVWVPIEFRMPDARCRRFGRKFPTASPNFRWATPIVCRSGNSFITIAWFPNGYWGDYNNKLPALWDKRNLFNILYGTPPMSHVQPRDLAKKTKARFVQSYKNVCPVARAVGYSEMTGHRFLIPDRSVQQTEFANGTTVTVNFGEKPYGLSDGAGGASRRFSRE